MRTLRSITGHTLRDRIPYQEVKQICNIQDIVRLTRQRRLEWNQHINRMEDRQADHQRGGGIAGCRRRKELLKAGFQEEEDCQLWFRGEVNSTRTVVNQNDPF